MNPAADIWTKVLALLQNEMTTTTINAWFDDAVGVALEGDKFVLYSPTPFKRDIIASRYVSNIQNALQELFSSQFQVEVLTEGELAAYEAQQQQPKNKTNSLQLLLWQLLMLTCLKSVFQMQQVCQPMVCVSIILLFMQAKLLQLQ